MSRYVGISPINNTTTKTRYVESADPVDLQNKVNAALDQLAAELPGGLIAQLTLAGGGDGFTFVVKIVVTTSPSPGGISLGAASTRVTCYLAANALNLAKAEEAVFAAFVAATGAGVYQDAQVAGASQGTRFMGMMVGGA